MLTLSSMCYFTATSLNRKIKWLLQSYKAACLACSLNNAQLNEYVQYKKRHSPNLPKLFAVSYVGIQDDGSWVLFHDILTSHPQGKVSVNGIAMFVWGYGAYCRHIYWDEMWISHVYTGPGIVWEKSECYIEKPLCVDPLWKMKDLLRDTLDLVPDVLIMCIIRKL